MTYEAIHQPVITEIYQDYCDHLQLQVGHNYGNTGIVSTISCFYISDSEYANDIKHGGQLML